MHNLTCLLQFEMEKLPYFLSMLKGRRLSHMAHVIQTLAGMSGSLLSETLLQIVHALLIVLVNLVFAFFAILQFGFEHYWLCNLDLWIHSCCLW